MVDSDAVGPVSHPPEYESRIDGRPTRVVPLPARGCDQMRDSTAQQFPLFFQSR
jgi:hypothetical protein